MARGFVRDWNTIVCLSHDQAINQREERRHSKTNSGTNAYTPHCDRCCASPLLFQNYLFALDNEIPNV